MQEALFYNALAVYYNGAYLKLKKLFTQHQSWHAAFKHLNARGLPDPDTEWQKLQKATVTLILRQDTAFPKLLTEIPFPPFGLYYRGAPIGTELKIAMVGTRKASTTGLAAARAIARELSSHGITVVSGLALGIDAASHQGALDAKGKTIAVLACGLDRVYPRQNERLAENILKQNGTIISEYPLGEVSYQARFLERNRIGSGLSKGVVVIEAPERSGTLATARFAVEQNRDVYVVPGAINNPNFIGSHKLIQSGASLVTSAQDILEQLGLADTKTGGTYKKIDTSLLDKNQQMIFTVLSSAGTSLHPDELIEKINLSESVINEALALLTIANIIKEDNGKYFVE